MWLGAHLSISAGLPEAAETASSLGANTFAYFTRNPRGGSARQIPAEEIAAWQTARQTYAIGPTVGHMPYTVNLAGNKTSVQGFARMVVAEDFRRVESFAGEYMCLHPGSHLGDGAAAGIERVVAVLKDSLPHASSTTMLLLETMAGSGSEIGASFAELAQILDGTGAPPTLGVCLDSCHLFSQGYDFTSASGIDQLLSDIDQTVGRDRVRAMHLNDSKFPLGSHKDRHQNLGQGSLGKQGILNILRHPWLSTLPLVMETPVEDIKEYAAEIALAKSWLSGD
ncbi:MAG: deoxyribonuclease IV [Sulfobacillus sp.]